MSGAALVLHQFRFDQKVFWRNPASVFFTVMLPLIFLLIFATIFGNDEIEELGRQDHHLLRARRSSRWRSISATMQSLAIRSPIDRESGLLKRVAGHAAADLGVRRRPGRQRARRLGADGRPGRRDRPARLRRRDPDRDDPGGARDPARRRLRLLLPRLRAHRGDPPEDAAPPIIERRRPAALLPLRHLHPRERDPGRASSTSPTCSRSATSSRPSSPPGTRPRRAPASSGATWRSSPPGASPGCWSRMRSRSAGSRER